MNEREQIRISQIVSLQKENVILRKKGIIDNTLIHSAAGKKIDYIVSGTIFVERFRKQIFF